MKKKNSFYHDVYFVTLTAVIIIYITILCSYSFANFTEFKKGFDWKLTQYQLEQIDTAGITDYFCMHRAFITYVLLPFYTLCDRSAVFVFLVNIIVCAGISLYVYLLGRYLLHDRLTALFLGLCYLSFYLFYEFQIRDGCADVYQWIIPAVYYLLKKKYKTGYFFLLLLIMTREDGYFISFMGVAVLLLRNQFRRPLILTSVLAVFFILDMTVVQTYFQKYSALYHALSPGTIVQNDLELEKSGDYVFSIYDHLGHGVSGIVKNSLLHPAAVITQLFSAANLALAIDTFKYVLFFPIIIGKSIFFYCIPYLYIFLAGETSSARAFSHRIMFAPGLFLTVLFSLYYIKKITLMFTSLPAAVRNKLFSRVSVFIVVMIIAVQAPYIYANIEKMRTLEYSSRYREIYKDIAGEQTHVRQLLRRVNSMIGDNEGIVMSERLHYFCRQAGRTYNFWFNTFTLSGGWAAVRHIDVSIPVGAFFLDASLDHGKGRWQERIKMLRTLISAQEYYVYYYQYPLVVIVKKKHDPAADYNRQFLHDYPQPSFIMSKTP